MRCVIFSTAFGGSEYGCMLLGTVLLGSSNLERGYTSPENQELWKYPLSALRETQRETSAVI